MPFFAPSYCHCAHPWTKSTQSYTYGDRSQSYCAPCHGGCPCPLCHSQGGGPCFCSTMASWSPVIFCSAEVVIPSTSSTPVVSMSTHYIMATWSFMGITIASLPLLHGPWSHPLLHSPNPPLLHSPSPLMLHGCSLVYHYSQAWATISRLRSATAL